jgi:predicted GIY-YIG superfamily endonuclease
LEDFLPVDKCEHTFADLAAEVPPKYMEDIQVAMQNVRPLSEFCTRNVGVKTIVKKLGKRGDFSGCYVLLHNTRPFYVGISRRVVARLRQHGSGTTHSDASLAYSMAREKVAHKVTRTAAMKNPLFKQAFEEGKQLLNSCSVAFIEIENPLELYLFEAYCAMSLDTCKWNSFRTH